MAMKRGTTTSKSKSSKNSAKTSNNTGSKKSKKNVTTSNNNNNANNRRKSSRPKVGKVPTSLVCPVTGETISIANATIKDIRDATKLKRPPWLKSKKYLVTVPSPAVRHDIYHRTAAALADLETKLLPTYGGRSWQVTVTIHDPGDVKSPFFVWSKRGQLEVAALPNVIAEKIPNPPRFPGFATTDTKKKKVSNNKNYDKKRNNLADDEDANNGINTDEGEQEEEDDDEGEDEQEEDDEEEEHVLSEEQQYWKELQEREIDHMSTLAFNHRSIVPLPVISVKWTSPLLETFRTRSSVYERAKELCQQEVLLDRHLHGYTANGIPIETASVLSKPPTKSVALKVGKYRFERDGVWIVGQEQSWQASRIQELWEPNKLPTAKMQ